MRVAITGASGFLGHHLVQAFQAASHEVTGVVRTPSKASHLGIAVSKADLTDVDALTQAFSGMDVLVANAALAAGRDRPPDAAFRSANVQGAHNQLEAARRAGVQRVIWISTVAVYKTRFFRKLDEASPQLDERTRFDWSHLTTDRRYSESKAEAERLAWSFAATHDLHLTALRPGPVYGPHDPKLTARYRTLAHKRLVVQPTVRVPHVYARDVADAAARAVGNEQAVGNAYNVTGRPVSPFTLVRTWARLARTRAVVLPFVAPLVTDFDDSAAIRDLSFSARSVEEGVEACLRGT